MWVGRYLYFIGRNVFAVLACESLYLHGTVNAHGFVWKCLCTIYKFSFVLIHSFVSASSYSFVA